MLRKENDEIQQLKSQLKDLTKEVEGLKLQLKVYLTKSLVYDNFNNYSEESSIRSISKIATNSALGNEINNKQLLNQIAKHLSGVFNNSAKDKSFSPAPKQTNFQQMQNLKNLSNRL